ncbi:MAG: magnesium transporter CorA family protein [Candidatus Margulisiibacteriota bacterium]|nr:MAG: magnesium transporter [Candidatus Margulisbacteria bacterium GWD2_39_127]OGI00891.1 MAG: magnesium transporter [Candidatus Margulisbacteria bacterium GWF2_38_17]OGI08746.1 MAG: magnesium transporter [Candidatus Margulisbacteria bacterium GWE2_39_32]PZM79457.1 MAG: magnesium transporter CorA family protein [Candidatus Margulisiibacteriota bacterium]HAR63489.1 magnesium transporter [Candidatus Margulisiibacteriota bacterium]
MLSIYKSDGKALNSLTLESVDKGSWFNLVKPTGDELKSVAEATNVPADFLKAALDREELSRIEIESDYILLITNIPIMDETNNNFDTLPLGIIITNEYFITVCVKENNVLTYFNSENAMTFCTFKKTQFLLQILYRSAKIYLKYLRYINHQTDNLERDLRRSIKNNALFQLLDWQKSLVYFTTSLKDNDVVLKKLLRIISTNNHQLVLKKYEDDEELLEDVLIENRQAIETVEIHSNILTSMMDAFASIISNNLNIVMKYLTSVTILVAVPTMIASFFGMNVHVPLNQSPWGFIAVVFISFCSMSLTAFVLWKKDMFS